MIFLAVSILLNTFIGVIFKHYHRLRLNFFLVIVINYWICVITGSIFNQSFPLNLKTTQQDWFPWSVLLGLLFISLFNLIAQSSARVGVTVTQASNKLSLIIPVLFSIFLYDEDMNGFKLIGISIALVAVYLTTWRPKVMVKNEKYLLAFPFIIFIGSGLIDTLTKYVESRYIKPLDTITLNSYLISSFFVAACTGTIVILAKTIRGQHFFSWRDLTAGIFLGIPNYFSIYFLLKALQFKGLSSSAIIPINNIGILACVSIYGLLVFNEKLNKRNYWGLGLTVLAILLIFIGG